MKEGLPAKNSGEGFDEKYKRPPITKNGLANEL